MASNGSAGQEGWPPTRPSMRSKLRNGTFIIPSTGERSRRQLTLRIPNRSTLVDRAQPSPALSHETLSTWTRRAARKTQENALAASRWVDSEDGHRVLKCTLAYLLGSLGTFWPTLSDFLGHRDGKHIVATLTVYFHPARTAGSMLEAVLVAIAAVAYAELVCVLSMTAAVASRHSMGSVAPAHAIVLIICVGGGLGFIGWVKQKLNQPLVNTASTLASIAIITVVTKEESVQDGYFSGSKILQVLKMLLLGITFTVAVNLLVWRASARHVLRESILTASNCLGDKLSYITKAFLTGSRKEVDSPAYSKLNARYNAAYSQMSQTLREARLEYFFLGQEKIYRLDKRLYKSVEAMSEAIGGLGSALNTQFTLLDELPQGTSARGSLRSSRSTNLSPRLVRVASLLGDEPREPLSVIEEDMNEPRSTSHSTPASPVRKTPAFQTPSDIFPLFMDLLGPSMKSLVYTLSETLRECPFDRETMGKVSVNEQLRESLRDALSLYHDSRGHALQELYKSIEMARSQSQKVQADIEEVAAACGHFSFTLQAVVEEMDQYLDILEALENMNSVPRSWSWLKFWRAWKTKRWHSKDPTDVEQETLLRGAYRRPVKKSALPAGIPGSMVRRKDSYSWNAAPDASTLLRRSSQKILALLRFLAREDVSFGIKVGIGAVLWAMFAFIPETRPVYQQWRGEWGLLSYMIVVAMTTGASNTTSTARFLGTLIGAACACISWLVSQGNPYLLALFGWGVALWNFYLILIIKNAPLGRISLLAYNVIVLYAYSLSQSVDDDDDDEGGKHPYIFDITYHRVVAVTLGILWGMVVCRLLWPISGRRKFREGLSVLYLQLGLIWQREPLGILFDNERPKDYMREGEQGALQRYTFKLESLRDSAQSEFELRGPFPYDPYGRIMRSTKHILDGFYAMRLITQQRNALSTGERALLFFTYDEREHLRQRISHMFQVLASSIMLEYPLTDAIPSIDGLKDKLLRRIYQFRLDHMLSRTRDDDDDFEDSPADASADAVAETTTPVEERDYALLYAYILVTVQVADELEKVRREIEGLFGVLDQDESLLEYT